LTAAIFSAFYRLYAPLTRHHARALRNLERAFPKKTTAERQAIALAMWDNFGRLVAESIHIDRFLLEPQRVHLSDARLLDRCANEAGLKIFVSLHTGNWELTALPITLRGLNPAGLYRVLANPYVDQFVRSWRTKVFPGGLVGIRRDTSDKFLATRDASRQLLRCVRRGIPLALLADHFDRTGISVPFLGQTASLSRLPAALARRFGAPLFLGRTIRLGSEAQFLVEMQEIAVPHSDDPEHDIRAATLAIKEQFEAWICQYPQQWLWSQAPLRANPDLDRTIRQGQ